MKEKLIKIRGVLMWIQLYPKLVEEHYSEDAEPYKVFIDETNVIDLLSEDVIEEIVIELNKDE